MSVMPDHWIRDMAKAHGMIEPFTEAQKREGVISYGVSSYGYDARVSREFKIFTNVDSAIVDPKDFSEQELRRPGDRYLRDPAQQLRAGPNDGIFSHPARHAGDLPGQIHLCALRHYRQCHAAGARMGGPRHPGILQHHAPAGSIYAGEGACQFLFLKGDLACAMSPMRDRGRQIHEAEGVTLPKL